MISASVPSRVPALISLSDGPCYGSVSQINLFLFKSVLATFITGAEKQTTMEGKGLTGTHVTLGMYRQLISAGGRRDILFSCVVTDKVPTNFATNPLRHDSIRDAN